MFAAAVGIFSLLTTSAIAFTLVKYAGAAYLIYRRLNTLWNQDTLLVSCHCRGVVALGLPEYLEGKITSFR